MLIESTPTYPWLTWLGGSVGLALLLHNWIMDRFEEYMDKRVTLPRKAWEESKAAAYQLTYDFSAALVGRTTNVTVLVDTALGAQGVTCAKSVLARVQDDFDSMKTIFGIPLPSVTCIVSGLENTHSGTGGAYHYSCSGTDIYVDADFSNPDRTAALFTAELSEVAQAAQAKGWNCGASNGEGLSRLHAEILYPGRLDDYSSAGVWLNGSRPNWVDNVDPTDENYVSFGCSVLFLTWLMWKDYIVSQMTQAAAPTLAQVYHLLTGKSTAWIDFIADVNARWPAGKPSGVKTDNPWPTTPPPPPLPPPPAIAVAFIQELDADKKVINTYAVSRA